MISGKLIFLMAICLAHLLNEHLTEAQDVEYWNKLARENLEKIKNTKVNNNKAKNIILFLGDGMGLSTITTGRILKGQKEGKLGEDAFLTFDRFPFTGLSKTYNTDKTVADSAGTATAFLCGVKSKYETVGVDDSIITGNCSTVNSARLRCIGDWILQSGRAAGMVTNMRVTHATPAPFYAAAADRWWENDSEIPKNGSECEDIAKQLVHNYPGRNLQVVFGGGRTNFFPNSTIDHEYSDVKGMRNDGANLIDDWLKRRKQRNESHAFVWNKEQFDQIDSSNTDFLLGLFEPSHMKDATVDKTSLKYQDPTLEEMTIKAIEVLRRNTNGYFLLVEGGLIDHMHHKNLAVRAINEMLEFDKAIESAMKMISTEDTLVIVTADHAQSMILNGYPHRGDPIFGTNSISNRDFMPYTSLLYTSGPGYSRNNITGRQNLTNVNTSSNTYVFQATIPRSSATHVGEDVTSYAIGPMAHLLTGVYEQNYIAHVMAYAAQVGAYSPMNGYNVTSYRHQGSASSNVAGNFRHLLGACITTWLFQRLMASQCL